MSKSLSKAKVCVNHYMPLTEPNSQHNLAKNKAQAQFTTIYEKHEEIWERLKHLAAVMWPRQRRQRAAWGQPSSLSVRLSDCQPAMSRLSSSCCCCCSHKELWQKSTTEPSLWGLLQLAPQKTRMPNWAERRGRPWWCPVTSQNAIPLWTQTDNCSLQQCPCKFIAS